MCFIVVLRYISDIASEEYKLPVVRRHFELDGSKSQLVIFPPPERDFEIAHSIYRNHGVHLMELVVVAGDLSCYLNVLGITCLSESLLLKQNFTTSNNSSQENWKNYVKTEICTEQLHNYLQGLKENFRVCDGRGSINLQETRVDIRSTVERGQATGNFITFPDYRFRSFNCRLLVDAEAIRADLYATKCSSCLEPPAAVPPPPLPIPHSSTRSSPRKRQNLSFEFSKP